MCFVKGKTSILSVFLFLFITDFSFAQALQTVEKPENFSADSLQILEDLLKKDSVETHTHGADTLEYEATRIHYDFRNNSIFLETNSTLKYKGTELNADSVYFSQTEKILNAIGDPTIHDKRNGNPPLYGYKMRYNVERKIGQIYYGSSQRDGQLFNGMDIRRLEDGRLQIARGDFSSCDQPHDEHYYFYARRMIAKPKENVVAAPVVLNIADVPIAILPILVFPIHGERSSGLIMPKIGGDQANGFSLRNLGVYWGINDYMDLQFSTDVVEGEDGTFNDSKVNGMYRYKKRDVIDGNVSGTINANDLLGNSTPDWQINFRHKQYLTPDKKSTLDGSGKIVSSSKVVRDQAVEEAEVLDQQATATMTYSKTFRNNSRLSVRVKQDKNISQVVTKPTTREFPDISYSTGGNIFTPDYDVLDTAKEEKWYEKLNYDYSFRGNVFQRIHEERDTLPDMDTTWIGTRQAASLRYTGKFLEVFNISPSMNYQNFWSSHSYRYPDDNTRKETYFDNNIGDGRFGDMIHKWSTSLSTNTKLYGIWKPEIGRFVGIRHVVSPSIGFTYAPEIDTVKTYVSHPNIGTSNFQNKQQTVNLSLGNDFDLKYLLPEDSTESTRATSTSEPKSENLKFLTVNTGTSYNFAAEDDQEKLTDMNSSIRINFTKTLGFSFTTRHSWYDRFHPDSAARLEVRVPIFNEVSFSWNKSLSLSGDFNTGVKKDGFKYMKAPWRATASYNLRYNKRRISQTLFETNINHSSNFSMNLNPTQNWEMGYRTTYNFDDGKFERHSLSFTRILHCWKLTFDWTPLGPAAGWNFNIFVIDIPDIKFPVSSVKTQ